MKRLFFALAVDTEVGSRVLRSVHAALEGEGDFAIYAVDDLHVTLCFLGSVEDERVPAIVRAANHEFRALFAPELRVGGCGDALPSREAPKALVSGVNETLDSSGRLAALRNRALQVALSQGWRPSRAERERPFRPHVTVARPRNGAPVPEDFWDLGSERGWTAVDVVLFESLACREDSDVRYRAVASWPLAVGPG